MKEHFEKRGFSLQQKLLKREVYIANETFICTTTGILFIVRKASPIIYWLKGKVLSALQLLAF